MEHGIKIDSDLITIYGDFFIDRDYYVTKKDLLLDVFSKYYAEQPILVICFDGENTKYSGFEEFLKLLCSLVNIPTNRITIQSHSNSVDPAFKHNQIPLGVFSLAGAKIPLDFDKDLTNAKFVGSLIRRFNISRLRISYELDQAFPSDTFLTCHTEPVHIKHQLRQFTTQYHDEIEWASNKTFDQHLPVTVRDSDLWETACQGYGDVWNKYLIEIVAETDSLDNYWFTEKTAKVLATGKPFLLMCGQGSLANLRDKGFKTFGSVIDESYDGETTPYFRTRKIVSSLQELYTSTDCAARIKQLYQIASDNIKIYQKFV